MITGVETAGLVLAAFPLLISALEHYRKGFEPLTGWWNFRTEFLSFQNAIIRQKVRFDENLEELLSSIIPSEAEMGALLQDPLGAAWRCPELEAKLKKRLPSSYQSYWDTIQDMQGSMDVLQDKLHTKDGKLAWMNDTTSPSQNRYKHERELQRIRFVLSKKKRGKLLEKLAANNDELQKLLTSSERLAPYRKRRRTPNMFKGIRDQARGLYSVLATGCNCQCPDMMSSHYANLVLEQRIDDSKKEGCIQRTQQSEASFTILLRLPRGSVEQPRSWHETETILLEAEECQLTSSVSRTTQHLAQTVQIDASGYTLPWRRKSPKKVAAPDNSLQPPEPQVSTSDLIEIADLCAAVQNARHGNGHGPLGYLRDHQSRRHVFYPSVKPTAFANNAETVTLASLLSNAEDQAGTAALKLDRGERYTISVTLASSLLQLSSSPWIGETWSKEDIFFLKAVEGSTRPIIVDKPYISRNLTSYPPQTHKSVEGQPGNCRPSTTSLQTLGIMLLELCFGQAIEDQPIRERYLGPDGKPNDMTDFSTAMTWWKNDALGEGGEEFYSAIRSCLSSTFATRDADLEDDDLYAAIYNEVVEPLERVVRQFYPNR